MPKAKVARLFAGGGPVIEPDLELIDTLKQLLRDARRGETPASGEEQFRVSFVPGSIEVSAKITSRGEADELLAAIQALRLLLPSTDSAAQPVINHGWEPHEGQVIAGWPLPDRSYRF